MTDSDIIDTIISDFSDPLFQRAFREYFSELGYQISYWDSLFRKMNDDSETAALIRTTAQGKVIGFIQFAPIQFSSWFFEETCGFIREFWVAEEFRNKNHGTALLSLAEKHFMDNGIYTCILTTETAARFYERHGYGKAIGCKAKNQDQVFIKHLRKTLNRRLSKSGKNSYQDKSTYRMEQNALSGSMPGRA